MNDDNKLAPGGDPGGGADAALEFRRALTDPQLTRNVQLRLEISGGVPGERYNLLFESTGDDSAKIAVLDEIKNYRYETKEVKLPSETIRQLLTQVDVNRMVSFYQNTVPIPPCSLVGRLQVSLGDHTFTLVFMADEEQARTAGFPPPREFEHVINAIYELAAKQMGTENIRP